MPVNTLVTAFSPITFSLLSTFTLFLSLHLFLLLLFFPPLICHLTESIKLWKSRGGLLVHPLLHKNALLWRSEMLNRRRRQRDSAGSDVDWLLLKEGDTDHILVQSQVTPRRELHDSWKKWLLKVFIINVLLLKDHIRGASFWSYCTFTV